VGTIPAIPLLTTHTTTDIDRVNRKTTGENGDQPIDSFIHSFIRSFICPLVAQPTADGIDKIVSIVQVLAGAESGEGVGSRFSWHSSKATITYEISLVKYRYWLCNMAIAFA
jgi:hypothetical protein